MGVVAVVGNARRGNDRLDDEETGYPGRPGAGDIKNGRREEAFTDGEIARDVDLFLDEDAGGIGKACQQQRRRQPKEKAGGVPRSAGDAAHQHGPDAGDDKDKYAERQCEDDLPGRRVEQGLLQRFRQRSDQRIREKRPGELSPLVVPVQ